MMKHLFVLLAFFTFGCSHSVYLPGSHRQKPEVSGLTGSGNIAFGVQQLVSVEVFNDITTDPPSRTDGISSDLVEVILPVFPFVDLNVGIFQRLEFYYSTGLGLRYLWLGEPGKEGWKSTLYGGLHSTGQSRSYEEGASSASTKLDAKEYGISIGRNFGGHRLLYVSLGKTDGNAKTKIQQPTKAFNYKDDFEHSIASLGTSLGERWFFWAEISATQTKWITDDSGSNTQDNSSFLIGTGYRW